MKSVFKLPFPGVSTDFSPQNINQANFAPFVKFGDWRPCSAGQGILAHFD